MVSSSSPAMLKIIEGLHVQQFLGSLADPELKTLKAVTLNLPVDLISAVDRLVGDPRTNYETRSEFLRHGMHILLLSWLESGWPDTYVYDVTMHAKSMRESARAIKLRQSFDDVIATYEVQVNDAIEWGDWALIERTLGTLQGYVTLSPDPYWQEYLRRTISKNPSVQRAISSYYDATRKLRRKDPKRVGADTWQQWLESLSTVE